MAQYEFSQEQNQLIGGLAGKMRFVGLFAVVLGLLNLLVAALLVVAIYRDQVPQKWKDEITASMKKLPADVQKKTEGYSLDKLPTNNHLWGIAINALAIGLFYLMMGVWTRSAGGSFQKIVATQGNDVSHLMNALGSLHSMYSLLYTLLMVTLLIGLIGIGMTLYHYLV